MRFLDAYSKVNDGLEWLVFAFTGAVILVIVALPFVAAVVRYVTGEGYSVLAEGPPQLVPWVVFPLLGVLLRHDGHIAVDVLPHYLSGARLRGLRVAVLGMCLLATATFAVFGANTVLFFRQLGERSPTEIEFPLWILYVSYTIGFALAANFALESLLCDLLGRPRKARAAAAS